MMMLLEGKTAVVTSATKGIGLACALLLAKNGATVFMAVRRVEDTQKICDERKREGYRMAPVFFDAVQQESYAPMVEEVIRKTGKIDILVNNFGIGKPAEDLDLVSGSEAAFFEILQLNLGSVYRISKRVIPHMIEAGGGAIVNISSVGGSIPDLSRIGYSVSKAAINSLTQQIALQYARNQIRCNAVLPGLTATDASLKNMPQEFLHSFLSHVPLHRMATPNDIANAVLFLASDHAAFITGHLLDVAGGFGLGTPLYGEMTNRGKTFRGE